MPFRSLLHNWLHQTVAGAAQDRIAAAREQAEQATAAPRTCDVAVVFALGNESGGLEDLLGDLVRTRAAGFGIRHGQWRKRQVVLAVSGAGCDAARRATDAVVLAHRPRWVISAGFCGGLYDGLKRNDIVIADSVADGRGIAGQQGSRGQEEKGSGREGEPAIRAAPPLCCSPASLPFDPATFGPARIHVGRLVTVDRIVRRPDEKRKLGEKHQAVAADLETLAVVEVCRRAGVPWLAIRVVSDAVDDELPREVERLIRQKTRAAQWGVVLGAFLSRPAVVKDLYKLQQDALAASDHLARFLARVIERL